MIETCVALACAAAGGAIAKATTAAAATRRLRGIGPTVARPRSGGSVRSVLTRQSQLLLPTEKRPPADAEALSHKLMVRAGLVRTREFIMKDAYSFDRDLDGLNESYERQREAYDRIFERTGLEWYRVEADVGAMGGFGAHEYMAPCAAGENDVALAPGYAANVEVASAGAQPVTLPPPLEQPELVDTPGMTTVEEVSNALSVQPAALLKAYPVIVDSDAM